MSDVFHRASSTWIPRVIREGEQLILELAVDFDRGYDTREYWFPITDAHLNVIRDDLTRHLLLWCALEPLCQRAGREGKTVTPDQGQARAVIDTVLLGAESAVESLLRRDDSVDTRRLIAHGGDPERLARGEWFAAMVSVRADASWDLVWELDANRDRQRRGVALTPLDTAVLKYTSRYLHGGAAARRTPDAVDPALLDQVLAVVAVAESACEQVPELAIGITARRAITAQHPSLTSDAVDAVGSLLYFEHRDNARLRRAAATKPARADD